MEISIERYFTIFKIEECSFRNSSSLITYIPGCTPSIYTNKSQTFAILHNLTTKSRVQNSLTNQLSLSLSLTENFPFSLFQITKITRGLLQTSLATMFTLDRYPSRRWPRQGRPGSPFSRGIVEISRGVKEREREKERKMERKTAVGRWIAGGSIVFPPFSPFPGCGRLL